MANHTLADLAIDNRQDGLFRVNRQAFTDADFLTFLGPGGYATPDDVEALESCQLGFRNCEVMWNDLSRGMRKSEPEITDELQMRAFWRQWHTLMQSPRGSATAVQQPIAV